MKFETGRSNYSIDSIERSVVMDNEIGLLPLETKQQLYDKAMAKLGRHPALTEILDMRHIGTYREKTAGLVRRIGVLPSRLVISDERLRDMCRTPYWHPGKKGPDGERQMKFSPCPNAGRHSSCPSFSPSAKEARARLDESDIFVMLQSAPITNNDEGWYQFRPLHRLQQDIDSALGKGSVLQRFGHGSCQACGKPCLRMGECRSPALYTPALESMGVAVGQLARDMAHFSGDGSWEIEFIKNFGLPNQTPKQWKYTSGLAIRFPPPQA